MAGRPAKQGIDYFPLDVDFFSDIKVRKVMMYCGPDSASVLIQVLCMIYKDEGYYIKWDDDLAFLVADRLKVEEGHVSEVIKHAVKAGFFNIDKFESYGILTSNGIQRRFIAITYKRKETKIDGRYLISDVKNSISDIHNSNTDIHNEQSKSKRKRESKRERESILNNKETSSSEEVKKVELSSPSIEKVDFVGLMDFFNTTFAGKLPAIREMTDSRRKAVKARIAQYNKHVVFEVLQKVYQSSFLLGGNEKNWKCDFDWIFKQANFTKIYEGNYDNDKHGTGRRNTADEKRESARNLKELSAAILENALSEES